MHLSGYRVSNVIRSSSIHYFIKKKKTNLRLSLLFCKVSHPSSTRSMSILQSLLAPVIVLAASI